MSATLVVYLFGSCVAYLIIIGDSYTKAAAALAHGAMGVVGEQTIRDLPRRSFTADASSLLREMSRLAPRARPRSCSAYTAFAIMCKGFAKVDDGVPKAVAFKLTRFHPQRLDHRLRFQCHTQVLAIFSEPGARVAHGREL